jgi:DNA-binding CsgD family transcriptional regulator
MRSAVDSSVADRPRAGSGDVKMVHVSPRVDLVGRRREQEVLSRLIDSARRGASGVVVVRGEPGIGKTALLTDAVLRSPHLQCIQISGTEYEAELAYAGLQQFCQPLMCHLNKLPPPQREALSIIFGISDGEAPDRFRVALAVLTLLGEAAREQPLMCVIDDVQWIDRASRQALAFVARRLSADPVLMVFASRPLIDDVDLAGLPELSLTGLDDRAARELLTRTLPGRLDHLAYDSILAEAAGNPLALLELHRVTTPTALAGGFALMKATSAAHRVESMYSTLVPTLPAATRMVLLIAAAEPTGDVVAVRSAARLLGLDTDVAAQDAEDAGLVTNTRGVITFRHPLVRSVVYQGAEPADRRQVHQALAEVMSGAGDTDRRAWHRAHAAEGPDDMVAAELETAARHARARGGVAAASAFLTAAVDLSLNPAGRVRRALAAARDTIDAGAPDAALALLDCVQTDALAGAADLERAQGEMLRAEAAFATRRGGDATMALLSCAERLEPLDGAMSRQTYLKALQTAIFAGRLSASGAATPAKVAAACTGAPPPAGTPTTVDVLLDGLSRRFTAGCAAAAPALRQALRKFCDDAASGVADAQWYGLAGRVALDIWDQQAWSDLANRQVDALRRAGRLTLLPVALAHRAGVSVHAGRFDEADSFIEEAQSISTAIGVPAPGYIEPVLSAFRGDARRTLELVQESTESATIRGEGRVIPLVSYAEAVLHNTFEDYPKALAVTDWAVEHDDLGMYGYALVERVEAASRGGERQIADRTLAQLLERTTAGGTDMARGMAARSRALVSSGREADRRYREAIGYLSRLDVDILLARVHLLYGEWLAAERNRAAAITQLRLAHNSFVHAHATALAARAQRGLVALGHSVTPSGSGAAEQLNRQELAIARLARSGQTNSEIAEQLFISPRTVEWHLTKIFGKLKVTSRRDLRSALVDTG